MTRKELYNEINRLGIADQVKKCYGDNYTRVSSDKLECLIRKHTPAKPTKAPFTAPKKEKAACTKNGTKEALVKLFSILQARKVISAKEAEEVASLL